MKNQVNPIILIVAVVIVLALVGGLYYQFLGAGASRKSDVASPYGMPKPGQPFPMPPPGGSGRNTITGEALPNRPHSSMMGGAPGMPSPPPGMKAPANAPSGRP